MNKIALYLDFYFKILVLILCLTIGLGFWLAGAKAALAATLKPASVINSPVLTVGDIFDGLSAADAAYVLGPAPQPGNEMVLNANTLMRVALTMDLPWKPAHSGEQIVIRRAATVIDENFISDTLKDALADEGINGRYDIELSSLSPKIILPENQKPAVEVTKLEIDHQKNWFRAELAAPSKEKALETLVISGKIKKLVSVPVVKNNIRAGDVISARDLDWIDLYTDEIQHDFLLNEDDVLNMTPRRMVEAQKPLRDRDLIQPQIVKRGETITILYENGPISLTAKGKALEDGAKGDYIRIVNTASNKSLEGLISDERLVTVQ